MNLLLDRCHNVHFMRWILILLDHNICFGSSLSISSDKSSVIVHANIRDRKHHTNCHIIFRLFWIFRTTMLKYFSQYQYNMVTSVCVVYSSTHVCSLVKQTQIFPLTNISYNGCLIKIIMITTINIISFAHHIFFIRYSITLKITWIPIYVCVYACISFSLWAAFRSFRWKFSASLISRYKGLTIPLASRVVRTTSLNTNTLIFMRSRNPLKTFNEPITTRKCESTYTITAF